MCVEHGTCRDPSAATSTNELYVFIKQKKTKLWQLSKPVSKCRYTLLILWGGLTHVCCRYCCKCQSFTTHGTLLIRCLSAELSGFIRHHIIFTCDVSWFIPFMHSVEQCLSEITKGKKNNATYQKKKKEKIIIKLNQLYANNENMFNGCACHAHLVLIHAHDTR